MNKFNRVVVVVMDSVGVGQLPDSKDFGDFGVNTLANISKEVGLEIPNLQAMGLANVTYLDTVSPVRNAIASYGKMDEKGAGKDTLAGHWEMMGNTLDQGFNQYTDNGFPEEVVKEFEKRTGRKMLANKAANGMAVIKEFYKEHMETGGLIVYTSADSTFQIAAHEDVVSVEELYNYCEIASELVQSSKYNVARVIARPFIGTYEDFKRTSNRHDYAQKPTKHLVLESLLENDLESIAIGKINDIFSGIGVGRKIKTQSNNDGVDQTIKVIKEESNPGLIFTNLVDFDSMYGHPRDAQGYADCLEEFDARIPELIENLKDDDLLIITADHGNDPTYKGNDHTREYVPLLAYSKSLKGNVEIPTRTTFEDLGETICENFGLESTPNGTSFLNELK